MCAWPILTNLGQLEEEQQEAKTWVAMLAADQRNFKASLAKHVFSRVPNALSNIPFRMGEKRNESRNLQHIVTNKEDRERYEKWKETGMEIKASPSEKMLEVP